MPKLNLFLITLFLASLAFFQTANCLEDYYTNKSLFSAVLVTPETFSPADEEVKIYYNLEKSVNLLKASIFDIAGNLIWNKVFDKGSSSSLRGESCLKWDGKDMMGELVHTGAYVYLLEASVSTLESDSYRGKLVVVRR